MRVVKKSDSKTTHPHSKDGCEFGYEVKFGRRGTYVAGRRLHLVRGRKYRFKMEDVPAEFPFYITQSAIGGGNATQDFLEGVKGSHTTKNDMLVFNVPRNCPSTLYYHSTTQPLMGFIINVTDEGELPIEDTVVLPSPSPNYGPSYRAPPSYTVALQQCAGAGSLRDLPRLPQYQPPPAYPNVMSERQAFATVIQTIVNEPLGPEPTPADGYSDPAYNAPVVGADPIYDVADSQPPLPEYGSEAPVAWTKAGVKAAEAGIAEALFGTADPVYDTAKSEEEALLEALADSLATQQPGDGVSEPSDWALPSAEAPPELPAYSFDDANPADLPSDLA